MSHKIEYRNIELSDSDIVSGNVILRHATAGDTLAVDVLDFQIWSDAGGAEFDADFLTADGKELITSDSLTFRCLDFKDYIDFVPGDTLTYYFDDKLISKFYISNVKRIGRYLYDFDCVSAIGYLENSMHFGGFYSGTLLSTILAEILSGITYTVDNIVGNIKIYGWLPYASKRDNLQQLTIATNLAIKNNSDGSLQVTALNSQSKGTFDNRRFAIGGDVDVKRPCTAVTVMEHYFSAGTEAIELYNDSFFTEEIILFPEPAHTLTITGGTILASGANYAKVQGSGTVYLTGKKYNHNIKRITEGVISGSKDDNIINVQDATLITSLNSKAVARKLYEVYSLKNTIKGDVLFGDERAGDVVSVINPYTLDQETAFAKKLDITMGGLLKASGEFLSGYLPSGAITGYQHRVVLTSGTSWNKPEGVTEYRAIIIGGGQGGQAGFNGEPGEDGGRFPQRSSPLPSGYNEPDIFAANGKAGDGGAGGAAGIGGKILDIGAISATSGAAAINISIGAGGAGGASNGAAGNSGGNSVFGPYSSANGAVMDYGYVDIMTAGVFAVSGFPGFKGQKGVGKDNLVVPYASSHTQIAYAGSGFTTKVGWTGHAAWLGTKLTFAWYGGGGVYGHSIAGCPGGSSYNSMGGDSYGADWDDNNGYGFLDGGAGGAGADGGLSLNATVYGSGGYGGHGGGGGGGGGAAANYFSGEQYEWQGSGGQGGAGGAGGNGRQGCIIIYY